MPKSKVAQKKAGSKKSVGPRPAKLAKVKELVEALESPAKVPEPVAPICRNEVCLSRKSGEAQTAAQICQHCLDYLLASSLEQLKLINQYRISVKDYASSAVERDAALKDLKERFKDTVYEVSELRSKLGAALRQIEFFEKDAPTLAILTKELRATQVEATYWKDQVQAFLEKEKGYLNAHDTMRDLSTQFAKKGFSRWQ